MDTGDSAIIRSSSICCTPALCTTCPIIAAAAVTALALVSVANKDDLAIGEIVFLSSSRGNYPSPPFAGRA
ncbi:exported hypothetical protein [uncultured Desulfatiglans sp.]|uniref:Uncharacterized protein n=1 Tax=Uncultured Desulfatiglans sp. TaxID=1748965 RepID=A0A653A930_UNCDX|nr:exported hypothetical protein [uncultured Desulfatiglans sp.]